MEPRDGGRLAREVLDAVAAFARPAAGTMAISTPEQGGDESF